MKLTETKLRALKPRDKPYQVADGRGLLAEVHPGGTISWFYRYTHQGRLQRARLGRYPEVTLSEARGRRLEAGKLLAHGKSPAAERKAAKLALCARTTVKELEKLYITEIVRRDRKDYAQIERYFRRYAAGFTKSWRCHAIRPSWAS